MFANYTHSIRSYNDDSLLGHPFTSKLSLADL